MDVDFVKECNKEGLRLSVWRIDKIETLEKYGKLINGNITTNEPIRVREFLENR